MSLVSFTVLKSTLHIILHTAYHIILCYIVCGAVRKLQICYRVKTTIITSWYDHLIRIKILAKYTIMWVFSRALLQKSKWKSVIAGKEKKIAHHRFSCSASISSFWRDCSNKLRRRRGGRRGGARGIRRWGERWVPIPWTLPSSAPQAPREVTIEIQSWPRGTDGIVKS